MVSHARVLRDAFGYLYPQEVDLLEWMAKKLPEESVIVNIGAGAGTSALTFVEARPDAIVYTVDIQEKSSPYGSLEGERNAFHDSGLLHLLGHSWFQVHGDSKEIGKNWLANGNPLADLVFIDGDHSYAGCMGDIEAWLPVLNTGGYMAVHDYLKAEKDPTANGRTKPYLGVDKAVKEGLLAHGYPVAGHVDTLIAIRKAKP